MNKRLTIDDEIQHHLEFLRTCQSRRTINIPENKKNLDFQEDIKKINYWRFIDSGDGHYLIARLLFFNKIYKYAMFCGSQCIENYLKGYIKFQGNEKIPQHHNLIDLLNDCKSVSISSHKFIKSVKAKTIVKKYNPFYELCRYPVQQFGPSEGYSFDFPEDLYILDYFVNQMRNIIPDPGGQGNIFSGMNISLSLSLSNFQELQEIFKKNNLNFSSERTDDLEKYHTASIKVNLAKPEKTS